jgi:Glycosyl hydrolases family 43
MRLGRILTAALAAVVFMATPASVSALIVNPVQYHGAPMSCPDPDVFNYGREYVASCTSDFSPSAFPIYTSPDLTHWRLDSYIFPHTNGERFWADEIHKIGSRWVAYYGEDAGSGMHIEVAWTYHLFGGQWQSRELYGHTGAGYIDPSVARNPKTGNLEMVFAQQARVIWHADLSSDGLRLASKPDFVTTTTLPWEETCVEGPVLWFHGGHRYVLYNAASTWDDSYAIGVIQDGKKYLHPLLRSGGVLQSTGIGAQPFIHNGHLELAFHVQLYQATHNMLRRWLAFAHLYVLGDGGLRIGGGQARITTNFREGFEG